MANKNIKLTTEEIKLTGTLNTDELNQGVLLVETESGEIRLDKHLEVFNGSEVEISVKRKIEQSL